MHRDRYTMKYYFLSIREDLKLDSLDALTCNGITQNVLTLYEMLNAIPDSEAKILYFGDVPEDSPLKCIFFDDIRKTHADEEHNVMVSIEAGSTIPREFRMMLADHYSRSKVYHYTYRMGHDFVMDCETLFLHEGENSGILRDPKGLTGVLQLPHHARGKGYVEVMYDTKCVTVPYVWRGHTNLPRWAPKDFLGVFKPDIYVMEPNISVLKNCLLPLCGLKLALQNLAFRGSVGKIYILNAYTTRGREHHKECKTLHTSDYFLNNVLSNIPEASSQSDKVYFCPRATFTDCFGTKPGILLSYQWDNQLNNLFYEAMHSGIVWVHNSKLLKESGLYYHDADVYQMRDKILEAVETFHTGRFACDNPQYVDSVSAVSPGNKVVQASYESAMLDVLPLR